MSVTEVAPGLHRLALPLGIHGVPTVSAYLGLGQRQRRRRHARRLRRGGRADPDGDPVPDGTAALEAALAEVRQRVRADRPGSS